MRRLVLTLSGCLIVSLCVATLAAPRQQDRPGIITQAKVLVDNRGRNEAIPVAIQAWDAGERPVTVQMAGTPNIAVTGLVQVHLVRQAWAYRTIKVPAGQDMAGALAAAGADGWDTTGIQTVDQSGLTLLLKRPQ